MALPLQSGLSRLTGHTWLEGSLIGVTTATGQVALFSAAGEQMSTLVTGQGNPLAAIAPLGHAFVTASVKGQLTFFEAPDTSQR